MKKLIIVVVMILLTGALIFNGCAEPAPAPAPAPTPAPSPTPPELIELKCANYFPTPAAQTALWEEYCGEIVKRSNGRVKITYYPGGSLLEGGAMADGIKEGIADMGYIPGGYTPGRFPMMEISEIVGFPSAFIAGHVMEDFYREFEPKEWDAYYMITASATGPFVIYSTKPIRTLEDMKGKKIRSRGKASDIMTSLGGVPVGIPAGETYDAISKGVADGVIGSVEFGLTFRVAEVCPYVTCAWQVLPVSGFYQAMNKNSYNNLPPDIQAVFDEVSPEWVEEAALVWNDADVVGAEFAKEMGVEFINLSPKEAGRWKELCYPVREQYVQSMVELGFSQEEVQGWFDYIEGRADYWLNKQLERGIKSSGGPDELSP